MMMFLALYPMESISLCSFVLLEHQVRIQRGGERGSGPPPGKSQVIWVSIGNKQLDPPSPWKKLDPPWKCWTLSGTLKNDRFLWNWPFDFCKICWGLKKKNVVRAFLCQTDLDPPDENSWIRAWASSYVTDFNTRNKLLTQKLIKQGYW